MRDVEKAGEDLYIIKQPFHGIFTGVMVVVGTNSIGIVDTGLENTPEEYVFPLLSELGHRPDEVTCVVNTHAHSDHIRGNKTIKERTKAKIAVHELEADRICDVDKKLKDGDIVKLGDREFRIVHTPGHTAGSICLYDEKNRTLITGDSVQGCGVEEGKLVSKNKKEYISSMKKLLKLKTRTLLMHHPYRTFQKAILKRLS